MHSRDRVAVRIGLAAAIDGIFGQWPVSVGERLPPSAVLLDVDFFGYAQRILKFDP